MDMCDFLRSLTHMDAGPNLHLQPIVSLQILYPILKILLYSSKMSKHLKSCLTAGPEIEHHNVKSYKVFSQTQSFVFLFVMKLLVLFCEKTKRGGDIFTIGIKCQDCLFVSLFVCLSGCFLFVCFCLFVFCLFVCFFVCLVVCLFVTKLILLFCEKTKRSGDIFTIGMECQDWTNTFCNSDKYIQQFKQILFVKRQREVVTFLQLEWNAKIGQDCAQTGNTEKQANARTKYKVGVNLK